MSDIDAFYTDLACERRRADLNCSGIEYKKESNINGVWERIKVKDKEGAKAIGRPIGIYDSLHTGRIDLLDYEAICGVTEELAGELCEMVEQTDVVATNILVVGLGNQGLTPDAIGPESADRIRPTRHIYELDEALFSTLGCAKISVLKAGVISKSGISSSLIVEGVAKEVKPDLVIAIDSLMARGRERLGSTFQITNTGVIPGSGLEKSKHGIDESTLSVPVICIGVPTVIDSKSLSCEEESKDRKTKKRMSESLFVSPKEIGDIVENAAEIIGGAINLAFGIFS